MKNNRKPAPTQSACVDCQHCAFSGMCREYLFERKIAMFETSLKRKMKIRAGELLYDEGDAVTSLIAVRRGFFKTVSQDGEIINFHTPGQLIGGDDLYRGIHRNRVIAVTDTDVCKIDYSALYGLSQVTEGVFMFVVNMLSEAINDNQQMLDVLSTQDSVARVLGFFRLLAGRNAGKHFADEKCHIPLSQKELSGLLGISESTLWRVMRRPEVEKLTEVRWGKVCINADLMCQSGGTET